MLISGFQPLSLLDYPGIICSIVFTQGCPFRCVYCHNPELIPVRTPEPDKILREEDILERLHQRKHIVEGICITGGEPTIHPDLPEFIARLKQRGMLVKLDTNGIHPQMVKRLIEQKLVDFIAMDVKHVWEKYPEAIGANYQNAINHCRETFHVIQASSIPHEFRTTVYSGIHSAQDLLDIAAQLNAGERYALQAIRYGKTLNPTLAQTTPLDLESVARELHTRQPALQVEVRS